MSKQVLITGAASGFGRGVVIELAKQGWNVVAGAENWPQVRDLRGAPELQDYTDNVTVIKLDVTDKIDRNKAISEHNPDVFLCNAGIMESGSVIETPLEIFHRVFEVNVWAGVSLIQGFGRKMVERGSGRIVWTSSQAGLMVMPWDAPYCASKHAVEALASAAHDELAPHGVQVCTINPGAYATGFNDSGMESQNQWRGQIDFRLPESPNTSWLEKQYDPAEMIAAMVDAVTAEHPPYRTFLPKEVIPAVKDDQTKKWDRTI